MAQAVAEQLKQEGSYQVRTMCQMCLNRCGIVATVEDGMVVRIDGDPDNPYNMGKACVKGPQGFSHWIRPIALRGPSGALIRRRGLGWTQAGRRSVGMRRWIW